ncbi:hypothetical protein V6Z11_A13G035600 [Gossypium hirsutum]
MIALSLISLCLCVHTAFAPHLYVVICTNYLCLHHHRWSTCRFHVLCFKLSLRFNPNKGTTCASEFNLCIPFRTLQYLWCLLHSLV